MNIFDCLLDKCHVGRFVKISRTGNPRLGLSQFELFSISAYHLLIQVARPLHLYLCQLALSENL